MDDLSLFKSIGQHNRILEEDANTRPYKQYLANLLDQLRNGEDVVAATVTRPEPDDNGLFVCLKEPLAFLKDFDKYSNSKEECHRRFKELLDQKAGSIIDQIICDDDSERRFWFNSTSKGVNLRPGLINNESSKPAVVNFGNPQDNVHALIVGATGSGKSVFLHNLLFSMMAEYAPWELNLYLVDFKKVTMSKYLSNCDTPHVKAVAATSEVRYVVSLLQYLNNCMRARQTLFSYLGLEKLDDLRSEYHIVLPRVVLLVDEFQQMFTEATSREEYVISEILTSITKLGRATGFHLIFASQEMTGTLGESAFANFRVRFALKCSSDVSRNFLGNSAAAEIGPREVGVVIENSVDGKIENNQRFQVPFIKDDEDYFDEFLKTQVKLASAVSYKTVHKYYQEDFLSDYSALRNLINDERVVKCKKTNMERYPNVADILTLGDAVVFNYKRIDCETVFLEYGSKKNIGIYSPRLKDIIYVSKLLSTNFKASPNAGFVSHRVLMLNDLFERSYDIKQDLGVDNHYYYNQEKMLEIAMLGEVKYRKETIALLQGYDEHESLSVFVRSALLIFVNLCFDENSVRAFVNDEDLEGLPRLSELCHYFDEVGVADIPSVIIRIKHDYPDLWNQMFEIVDMLYQVRCEGKDYRELFDLTYMWVVGTEMIDSMPRGCERLMEEAPNYRIVFINVGSADSGRALDLFGVCDYLFISGNQERMYLHFGIPYTNKSEDSKVIDFKVRSAGTVRSFKKYFSEDEVADLPKLDFDEIMDL